MSELLTQSQISRGMRMSIIDGILAQGFYIVTYTGSVFIVGFALLLGASNFEIGILAAVGPLLSVVYLWAARILERSRSRKRYYLLTSGSHRVVFFILLFVPFIIGRVPARGMIVMLLAVVFLSVFFGIFQTTAWTSWMADMIPEDRRGAFFGRRNMICGIVGMVFMFFAARFIDAHKSYWGYIAIFAAVTVLALLSLMFAARQPDPPMALSANRESFKSLWKKAYASSAFRNFLLFNIAWNFTIMLAGPFYNVYMLRSLHISISQITIWGIIGGIAGTAIQPYWGALGDKAGNKSTILFCLIGSCMTAFGWLWVTPANAVWVLPVIFALSGLFDTGIGLIAFNMLLGILPEKDKPSFLAMFEAVLGTVIGFSPALGGYLAQVLPSMNLPLPSMDPVFMVIVLSTALRVLPLFFVVWIPEQRGRGFGFMVREFVLTNPIRLFANLYYVQKSPDEKLVAIDNLSKMRSKAALPDLITSMQDLSPRVRQAAVEAVGEIGDPRALPALIDVLDDPSEEIQGEASIALGKLGDLRAVPSLLIKLVSEDHYIQRCTAAALGELKAKDAAGPLIKLMQSTQHTSVLLACAEALGRLGEYRVVEPLLDLTRKIRNPSVKHSVVASAASLIDQKGELYRALSSPDRYLNSATDEILSARTVRLVRDGQAGLNENLRRAREASHAKNYNEAILEMKVLNQVAVREFLAGRELKNALGFEAWVRLLDSSYNVQLDAVQRVNTDAGIALAIVDYYARHCPAAAEPDMEAQELLLALYAFKAGQIELHRMIFGKHGIEDKIRESLKGLSNVFSVN